MFRITITYNGYIVDHWLSETSPKSTTYVFTDKNTMLSFLSNLLSAPKPIAISAIPGIEL